MGPLTNETIRRQVLKLILLMQLQKKIDKMLLVLVENCC